jgi:hypothetical protein
MAVISEAEAEAFCVKLNEFGETLSEEQKPLFHAILRIAWRVGVEQEDLGAGFDGCFTPAQANLIMEYDHEKDTPSIIRGHLLSASGSSLIRG